MMGLTRDPGSFRDPRGSIYSYGDRIYRAIDPSGADSYRTARDSGALDRLVEMNLLLPFREVSPADLPFPEGAVYLVEHPRVPFISYPYEWSFTLHQAAALHHLDIHLAALESGFTLTDSSAYNIQFIGLRPVFIDHLSLVPYQDGMIWDGHRQFCCQFLNPLIMWSYLGVAPNPWFRGAVEGISPEELAPLLSIRHRLSWTILTHVVGQAALGRLSAKPDRSRASVRRSLSRNALLGILTDLRGFIDGLRPPSRVSVWSDYSPHTSYGSGDADKKRELVEEMVADTRPRLVFDLGCNSGHFSEAALRAGAQSVVGFDFDFASLEIAYERFAKGGSSFLPLWLDAANPSPSQGWSQNERKGLQERGPADALVALAVIHHLAIGRNVPLPHVISWLTGLAPEGIIEFPQKGDPMVAKLLRTRDDIFPDYTEENFLTCVESHARIRRAVRLPGNDRLLVWYKQG